MKPLLYDYTYDISGFHSSFYYCYVPYLAGNCLGIPASSYYTVRWNSNRTNCRHR